MLSKATKAWLLSYGPFILSLAMFLYKMWRQRAERLRNGVFLNREGVTIRK